MVVLPETYANYTLYVAEECHLDGVPPCRIRKSKTLLESSGIFFILIGTYFCFCESAVSECFLHCSPCPG